MRVHHIDELIDTDALRTDTWFTGIGVFPTEGDGTEWWSSFLYTVGFMPNVELWAPTASIEGRQAGHQLTGFYVDRLARCIDARLVGPGDSVRMPIGVAGREDDDDVDTVWWIGDMEPARYRQANLTPAEFVIPILWSSPLGWRDE